jgi:hypothetical protein
METKPVGFRGMAARHPLQTIPFRGGAKTAVEVGQLGAGEYSWIQNLRQRHPGMEQRKGQAALYTVADGTAPTNKVLSLYGFSKGRRSEGHLLAQMSDGDILDATNLPPAVTTGAFGTEIFSGSAGQSPGAWSNMMDILVHSNGIDQHQLWPGTLAYVGKFVVYKSAAALPDVPGIGEDYSDEVSDAIAANVGTLGTIGTNATDALCVFCPIVPSSLKFTMGSVVNAVTATMVVSYWNGAWTALTKTDNTLVTGKTLAQTGTVTWTAPTDALPYYMYGRCGYWLKITFSAALTTATSVAECEYTANMQDVKNIWNGVLLDAIEAQVYIASDGSYKTYGGAAIMVGGATSSDAIYFAAADNIEAVFIDVGQTPNVVASTTINTFSRWTGAAWTSVGTYVDGTSGFKQSGWIRIPRSSSEQKANFNNANYYANWYKLTVDKTLTTGITIWIQYRPYFDIEELGKGVCNAAWKGRGVYSFNRWPDYLYLTAQNNPTGLNGIDYGIIQVGDGRAHKVTAMRKFHNELLAWQEEKGEEGGCLTLIEGYSPTTYGKLILSSRLGTMNSKCVTVVDGVMTSTATDEVIKTLAFALSRYGVYITDGLTCSLISDDIANYFDPTKAECIRRGYEAEMWLGYDSTYNVIRLGLVSGTSATLPNVFPVFDLIDKTWSFDTPAQELSCAIELGAGSGDVPVVQVGGGIDDGLVYLLNSGLNDVAVAINAYATVEVDMKGAVFLIREFLLRCKAQTGNITLTPSINSIAQTAKTLSMVAEVTNQTVRRHLFNLNLEGHHISLKFAHPTISESMLLEDFAIMPVVEVNK